MLRNRIAFLMSKIIASVRLYLNSLRNSLGCVMEKMCTASTRSGWSLRNSPTMARSVRPSLAMMFLKMALVQLFGSRGRRVSSPGPATRPSPLTGPICCIVSWLSSWPHLQNRSLVGSGVGNCTGSSLCRAGNRLRHSSLAWWRETGPPHVTAGQLMGSHNGLSSSLDGGLISSSMLSTEEVSCQFRFPVGFSQAPSASVRMETHPAILTRRNLVMYHRTSPMVSRPDASFRMVRSGNVWMKIHREKT